MDPTRFDHIAKHLATRSLTRRRSLAATAGAALAALTGGTRGTRAQGTPAATPAAGAGSAGQAANNATMFVQTASSGTFLPNLAARATPVTVGLGTPASVAAQHGAYLLTLHGHSGETIAFSDRPQRNFGEVKTTQFFTSMGFTAANPPNAALVADSPQQADDVLLVELLTPAYDTTSQTLTYEANILTQYTGEMLKPLAAQQQDQQIAETFTTASLFIDDCPDATPLVCVKSPGFGPLPCASVGDLGNRGMCWSWNAFDCVPCQLGRNGAARACNTQFPACEGQCVATYPC